MEGLIDLHIHTNMSDGEYSPKEIIDMAIKNNVKVLAITDHDTIDAYTEDVLLYAKQNNILLIPGVEISTKINKCGIHVLGYNISLNDKNLKNMLDLLRNNRHIYLAKVSSELKKLGYHVSLNELDKIEAVTKGHIASDVVSNSANYSTLIKNFGYIPNKGEFIESVMNEGCPAYVKKETITPTEAVMLIKNAGGKAVLAHPVAYKYEDGLSENDIFNLIRDMEIEAIEGNYIYVDKNNVKINESHKWNEFCKNNNLLSTIGSDFHKFDSIRPCIGLVNEDVEFNEVEMERLLEYLQSGCLIKKN